MRYSRRQFMRAAPAFAAFVRLTLPDTIQPGTVPDWPAPPPPPGSPVDESFPSQHPALAKEIVGVSHFNFARVKEMVTQHPALAKASWDWGFGDWETALGAASHTGRREIAELLLENGAPPTLFSAAMLGQLDLVKAFMAAMPGAQRRRGPHSLSLMVHARAGGPPAAAVVAYLESIGGADIAMRDEPLTPGERATLDGRYAFGDRPRDHFTVTTGPNQVAIVRAGATSRNLQHLGGLEFTTPGAPAVRFRFEREAAAVTSLTLADGDLVLRARKVS
jgi:hypothetical protein